MSLEKNIEELTQAIRDLTKAIQGSGINNNPLFNADADDSVLQYARSRTKPLDRVPINQVYNEYLGFCFVRDVDAVSRPRFTRQLSELYGYESCPIRVDGSVLRAFVRKKDVGE